MENLLLATLKPDTAPVRNSASARDRAPVDRDEGPSAFDRELGETVRGRRGRQSRTVERGERSQDREPVERPEPPGRRDDASAPTSGTETGAAARPHGTADEPLEQSLPAQPAATAGEDGPPAPDGNDTTTGITAAVEIPTVAEAQDQTPPDETAALAGDVVTGNEDTLAAEPIAGPGAIAVTATDPTVIAVQAAAKPVSDATPANAAGPAPELAKADAGNGPPELGADDTSDADDDEPGARPGRSADRASERGLAARAVFTGAGADHAGQDRNATPALVDTLGATTALDGAPGVGRAQADVETVILRLAQVGQSGRLPAIPVNTLAFHIARNFDKGVNRFDIRLDPPELGRIDVRMEVDGDARVRVHLVVERAEALDFLQRDARALERALADAGLDADAESLTFSLDTGNRDDDENAASGDGPAPDLLLPAAADDDPSPLPTHYVSRSGVDIRV